MEPEGLVSNKTRKRESEKAMQWESFFKQQLQDVNPYQPGMREEQIRSIAKTDDIHKLSSNESPVPPFPSAIKAMQESLPLLNEYCDGSAYLLKKRIAEKYQVEQNQIMVGNGANELLTLLAEACLEGNDRVAFCWPSFVVYKLSAQIAGTPFDEVPLASDGSFDLEALLAAITPDTKIVYICSPNNPSGVVIKKAVFEKFITAVPKHVLVVVDNAYIEFVEDEDTFDALEYFDGERPLVVLRSFSKIYGLAGVRIGYGFAPAVVVEAIDKVREPFNVNSVAQAGALACIDDQDEIVRRRNNNSQERARLCEAFDRLNLRYFKSSANFVWVFLPEPLKTFQDLLERGVIVRAFGPTGGLRVGVGTSESTDATIKAFDELFG
jgi:histidinol-phosphate aminotransferase